MNLLDYVLNNDEMMNEKTAETLIISRISASVKEVTEAMEGIITPFQKNDDETSSHTSSRMIRKN